jgi:hypothetical protein
VLSLDYLEKAQLHNFFGWYRTTTSRCKIFERVRLYTSSLVESNRFNFTGEQEHMNEAQQEDLFIEWGF